MAFMSITPEATQAIKLFLAKDGTTDPIRIDIQSTGCCDASLGLSVDKVFRSDLIQELDGLEFMISLEIHRLVGTVHIDHISEEDKTGFVLTSSKPLNEWEGFGVCAIRTLRRSLGGIDEKKG